MAFCGQSRSSATIARLTAAGIGECFTAGQDIWPPRRSPFVIDCGTFGPWRRQESYDPAPFLAVLKACRDEGRTPEWVVAPDLIGGGLDSLELSIGWLANLHGFRVMLAVQDGMHCRQVERVLHRFHGIFVGGTLGWKIRTSREWVRLAHRHGKPCHIGRVGIPKRVRWAQRIGADSIDSCQPLWSVENLDKWIRALGPAHQPELFKGAA